VNCAPCNDYELTISSDQTRVSGGSFFYNSNLNADSYETLNDREFFNVIYVYGAKLNPDGRLLFQPSSIGIDVFDGELGTLLDRISISAPLSTSYDALVSDGKDNLLVAITGAGDGIALVDLSSITEPPALPYTRSTFGKRMMVPQGGIRPGGQRQATRLHFRRARRSVSHSTQSWDASSRAPFR
jgi:hypothetical protein